MSVTVSQADLVELLSFLQHFIYPYLAEKFKEDLSVNFNVPWSHEFYFTMVLDVLKCVFLILGQLAMGKQLAWLSSQ